MNPTENNTVGESTNDPLEFGKTYNLWRDGEFVGSAQWLNDPNIGPSFIKKGAKNIVFKADKWEKINE